MLYELLNTFISKFTCIIMLIPHHTPRHPENVALVQQNCNWVQCQKQRNEDGYLRGT